MQIVKLALVTLLISGCARERAAATYYPMAIGKLPLTDVTLTIPGLKSCTDDPDQSLRLKLGQPVYVLVHGCFGSSGQFRGLAQVLAFHGQQTVCFTYNDRERLTVAAEQLRRSIDLLATQTRATQITLIGHSQGALIAHKSLTDLPREAASPGVELRLVTISGPFSGIAAAKTCGRAWLYPLTLGLLPMSCYAVTGAKWKDITYSSQFIRDPGTLIGQVSQYLKIDTDERGTCRRETAGHCAEDDDVFSLSEQRNATIEKDKRARRVEVPAGHVEIVGDQRIAPIKLIAILQEQGAIPPTAPEGQAAFNQMISRVYLDDIPSHRP
jgi:pimeloyl-ACP methyl ester carboxylesterase